jgi:hypothetical protein
MKKNILAAIILTITLSGEAVFAGIVTIDKARKVATNFFTEKTPKPVNQIVYGKDFIINQGSHNIIYVFNINEGFIAVSAQDAAFPILFYSFEGNFSGENKPPAFTEWIRSYQAQIELALYNNVKPEIFIQKAWKKYSSENFIPQKSSEGVAPMLYTNWSQGCYYNSKFPADTNCPCDHLWTGCVATAMGQVMKFYNYPKSGTGSHGYNSNYGWVEADFENTEYDWFGMNYHLDSENDPVAELLFHCAISVNSQFFPYGTGALDLAVKQALVQYFDYSSNTQFFWRDSYAGDWLALLRTELDQGRPVIYGGADSVTLSGHTLVCDGYQDSTFFHFNWGWNGSYNGYFYLDSLIAGNNYFNFQHDAIVGIEPEINGIIETYPPVNLSSEVEGRDVSLIWDAPELPGTLEFLGYNVRRDGWVVNPAIVSQQSFTDSDVSPGDHEYTVTSVYIGRESTQSITEHVYISGLHEIADYFLSVYPVPVSDFLIIQANEFTLDEIQVKITDIAGKEVLNRIFKSYHNPEIQIELPDQLSGIYLLQVKDNKKCYYKKIVIVKN